MSRPEDEVETHPEDARRYGLEDGCKGRIVTRQGSVEVKVFVTDRTPEASIF